MTNVLLSGMMGRMGSMIVREFIQSHRVNVVGALVAPEEVERGRAYLNQIGASKIPVSSDISNIFTMIDSVNVFLDFSILSATEQNLPVALQNKIPSIIGVSGFAEDYYGWMESLSIQYETPILLVPNFSIGILLVKKMALMARKYFPRVELIETHHDLKRDAPSGTSLDIATTLAKIDPPPPVNAPVEELDMGSRGMSVRDVRIHSIRLPGVIAEQSITFASKGEVLNITHRTTSREAFLGGIYYAIDHVTKLKGFHVGLETIMDV